MAPCPNKTVAAMNKIPKKQDKTLDKTGPFSWISGKSTMKHNLTQDLENLQESPFPSKLLGLESMTLRVFFQPKRFHKSLTSLCSHRPSSQISWHSRTFPKIPLNPPPAPLEKSSLKTSGSQTAQTLDSLDLQQEKSRNDRFGWEKQRLPWKMRPSPQAFLPEGKH